ncbi:pilus (MSHA type) biogenesis protein MshL [Helicobacter didelphidarum]|nr:pilus (MSHA type) biogenesis protein MshL [Helicobacter didelphidarum]
MLNCVIKFLEVAYIACKIPFFSIQIIFYRVFIFIIFYCLFVFSFKNLLIAEVLHGELQKRDSQQNHFIHQEVGQHETQFHDFVQDSQTNVFLPSHSTGLSSTQNQMQKSSYSILADLREAFKEYSHLHKEYTTFLKQLQKNNIISNPFSDTESHRENSLAHTDLSSQHTISPFHNLLLHSKNSINSFDMGLRHKQKHLTFNGETFNASIHTTKPQEPKQAHDSSKFLAQNKLDNPNPIQTQQDLKSPFDIATLAPKCLNRKFNLKKEENINALTILNALAKDCDFSIQYQKQSSLKRDSKEIFGDINMLNIHQKELDFILNLLLYDIFYEVKPHRLILKDHGMQIFEINYISSTRMAQSNTDVLFSQEQHNQSMGYGIGGYSGSYSLGFGGLMSNNGANSMHNNSLSNHNLSHYLDNLSVKNQLRNQMNYANNQFGKSGTKIYSVDEINFWADIESKLNILLDSKHGDRFMIDKGAGLISVWTTKNKMEEIAHFLQNLERKINLQVAIDVEILSLTHFNSNNVGIDWQEIFSILNPTQSKFNVMFGGSSSFTLSNSSMDLRSIFNLLKTYGDLRSLSNPKIMALNNQPAIISVGSVLRYSQNLVFQSNNTNNTIQNTSTQYPSVFAGILLDITPSISQDEVILRINPSITKTKDPELENMAQALTSPPNLSTNQLSSIVRLKNGQRVIIGGLLSNITQNTTQAIPGIGEVKGLKNIFGKTSKIQRNEELIIIITPHIIE